MSCHSIYDRLIIPINYCYILLRYHLEQLAVARCISCINSFRRSRNIVRRPLSSRQFAPSGQPRPSSRTRTREHVQGCVTTRPTDGQTDGRANCEIIIDLITFCIALYYCIYLYDVQTFSKFIASVMGSSPHAAPT